MVHTRYLNTILLLSTCASAFPRWWKYDGPTTLNNRVARPQGGPPSVYTIPPGGFVSNGVLYLTTTLYLQPGELPPTTSTTFSTQAIPTSQAAQASEAPHSNPPAQAPPVAVTSQAPAAPPQQKPTAQPQPTLEAPTAPPANEEVKEGSITPDVIAAIVPSSSSCDPTAQFGNECATAAQAAPALTNVFAKYGINNAGAQAAVIAWEAFESGNFKYKMNHFPEPGRPGQGTRCMMMPPFVAEYATQLVGADKVQAAGDPAKVLALVNGDDESSFGGGAWFMKAKCGNLIDQFASSPDEAWASFITSCVETTAGAERDAYWTSAKKALGV